MIEPETRTQAKSLKRRRFFAAAAAYAAFAASICILCAQTVFDVTVQPFADTRFFADGVQATPQVLETDNTLALLRFTFADEPQRLEIRHEGFRPVVLTHEELCRKRGFAFLSREDSDYDVVSVFQTGAKPKSVRFINDTQAAVTLLEANGADIIDTQSGTVRRIRPPADYACKEGFAESLVLPERNELWLSQMVQGYGIQSGFRPRLRKQLDKPRHQRYKSGRIRRRKENTRCSRSARHGFFARRFVFILRPI